MQICLYGHWRSRPAGKDAGPHSGQSAGMIFVTRLWRVLWIVFCIRRRSVRDIGAMIGIASPVGDRIGLAIDKIAQSGLSSLNVIDYSTPLFR